MGLAAGNIILTGGNVKFPNFEERFLSELRPLVPDIYPVKVSRKAPYLILSYLIFYLFLLSA